MLCGTLKGYTAPTGDKTGEIAMEQEIPGLKQLIEQELKNP
jgi:hypothetical protein